MPSATRLKDEGNALYAEKKFGPAREKYSAAIALDGSNAILYANRAACELSLKNYERAEEDARKSTELDPTYTKAWGRLAAAQQSLGDIKECIESWQKALSLLPPQGARSASEQRQHEQYIAALAVARTTEHEFELRAVNEPVVVPRGHGRMPYDVAGALIAGTDGLAARNEVWTCAYMIHAAHDNFKLGVDEMNKGAMQRTDKGSGYFGQMGALENITNGLLMDERAFAISQPDFQEKYNMQLRFELAISRAWNASTAEEVIRALPQRLREEGWSGARLSLSVTVRAWIMRACVISGLRQDHIAAEAQAAEAAALLEWGDRQYASVSYEERGSIFRPTFIRGVRSLRLDKYMNACLISRETHSLEGLRDLAEELLEDCEANQPTGHEPSPGFFAAFHLYPAGRALSCLGMYHRLTAEELGPELTPDVEDHYLKACDYYIDAAERYPPDDENHAWFLNSAAGCMLSAAPPVEVILPLARRVTVAASHSRMLQIWANSAMARGGRDRKLRKMQYLVEDLEQEVAAGRLQMSSRIRPNGERL